MKLAFRLLILFVLASLAGTEYAAAQLSAAGTYAGTAGGTANAISLQVPNVQNMTDLVGVPIRFIGATTNAGTATIQVNALPAMTAEKKTYGGLTTLSAGDVVAGQMYEAIYDGTVYEIAPAVWLPPPGTLGQALAFGNSHAPIWVSDCINIQSAGASGSASDNRAAVTAAIAALPSIGGCIYSPAVFPSYAMGGNEAITGPASGDWHLTMIGDGTDATIFSWAGGGGFTITTNGSGESADVGKMSLTSGSVGGGTALRLIQTGFQNLNNYHLYDLTIRGSDGYWANDYWGAGVYSTGVSNLYMDNLLVSGACITSVVPCDSPAGIGIKVEGITSVHQYASIFNIHASQINRFQAGFIYGDFIQGVTIAQTNMDGNASDVLLPAVSSTTDSYTSASGSLAMTFSGYAPGLSYALFNGASISGTTLTVPSTGGASPSPVVVWGGIGSGDYLYGAGVAANTQITTNGTCGASTCTFSLSVSQSVGSETMIAGAQVVNVTNCNVSALNGLWTISNLSNSGLTITVTAQSGLGSITVSGCSVPETGLSQLYIGQSQFGKWFSNSTGVLAESPIDTFLFNANLCDISPNVNSEQNISCINLSTINNNFVITGNELGCNSSTALNNQVAISINGLQFGGAIEVNNINGCFIAEELLPGTYGVYSQGNSFHNNTYNTVDYNSGLVISAPLFGNQIWDGYYGSNAMGPIQGGISMNYNEFVLTSSIAVTSSIGACATPPGTCLNITAGNTGLIVAGMSVTGTGVAAGTYILGGTGSSWVLNQAQTVSSESMTVGSPWHFYASHPATLYLTGSGVSSVTINGSAVATAVPTSSPAMFSLWPLEAFAVTYSSAITLGQDVH